MDRIHNKCAEFVCSQGAKIEFSNCNTNAKEVDVSTAAVGVTFEGEDGNVKHLRNMRVVRTTREKLRKS